MAALTDDLADTAGGDDTDDLTERVAAAIDRTVYAGGFHGPHVAAVRVLADPELRDALRAADVVAQLADLHRPRMWADNVTCVCLHCDKHWPCRTAELMGVT